MASVNGSRGSRAPISGINVTPLVDVMLVLLVIMMVSATYIVSQALKVNLPKSSTSEGGAASVATVTVTADHKIYLNKQEVSDVQLGEQLRGMVANDRAMTLVVSA